MLKEESPPASRASLEPDTVLSALEVWEDGQRAPRAPPPSPERRPLSAAAAAAAAAVASLGMLPRLHLEDSAPAEALVFGAALAAALADAPPSPVLQPSSPFQLPQLPPLCLLPLCREPLQLQSPRGSPSPLQVRSSPRAENPSPLQLHPSQPSPLPLQPLQVEPRPAAAAASEEAAAESIV